MPATTRSDSMRAATPARLVTAAAFVAAALAVPATAQVTQGPSSSRTPYLLPSAPNPGIVRGVTSIATATDMVPTTGAPATPYEFGGIIDGLGAFDNGDGTVTIIAHHELGSSVGVIRAHGAKGSYISATIVDKTTLAVVSASDAIDSVVDAAGVLHNTANANALALNRFCSADLPAVSAFYNAASGLGTQERIFMGGEEGGANGWAMATVLTGAEKGLSYILPAFNLATNGSGINAVGGWENLLASPYTQDLTIVAGTNDGGTGVMNNTVNVYVGTKQSTGTEPEKAGLKNGQNYIVSVAGNPTEIVNGTTRATNIVSGTRFSLQLTSGTQFSRPEDGAWDPTNPRDFYFVTTDRLDTLTNTGANQTIGASGPSQVGMSRLWRLRFDDIHNPLLGGTVTLVIDGSKNGQKVNMLDNMCVAHDGRIYLTEDPGNSTYIGKTWAYDVNTDTLVQLLKFDPARWGDLVVNGGTPGGISPHTNDKEISGVVDVTDLFPHAADETVLLIDAQDHSTNAAVADAVTVEGGQLLLVRVALGAQAEAYGAGCGLTLAAAPGSKAVLGNVFLANVGDLPVGMPGLMMVGLAPAAIDLGFVMLPGCDLLQDAMLSLALPCTPTTPTTAQFGVMIPADVANTGLEVFFQAWTGMPGTLETSNGLKVTLGF